MSFLSGIVSHVVSGGLGGLLGIAGSAVHTWLSIQQQKATTKALELDAEKKIRIASYAFGDGPAALIIAWAHLAVSAILLGFTLSFLWWVPGTDGITHVVVHFTGVSVFWLFGTLSRSND